MIERGAALLILGAVLTGCSGSDGGKDKHMTEKPREMSEAQDASEVPDAVVIRPEHNPNMIYDPETQKVTDTVTGDVFSSSHEMRSGGIHTAGIKRGDGSPGYGYELKNGTVRNSDGTIRKNLWLVHWARREDWMERFVPIEMGLDRAHRAAEAEAQNDSLGRVAEFLRAEHEGIFRAAGKPVEGETVVVDRRMDDTRGERVW